MNQREILYLTGGLVAGLAAGILIARSVFKGTYERIADEEIASVKERYRYIRKEGLEPEPEEVIRQAEYSNLVDGMGYSSDRLFERDIPDIPADDAKPIEEEKKKIFVLDVDHKEILFHPPDFEEYARDRDMSKPYIISIEEFMNDKLEYDKISLDYYEEDDVVADQTDRPYENHEDILGDECLERFGFGSNDNNVVYVRNDDISIDFEISRDKRSYTEVALGIKEAKKPIGKFKEED